MKGFTMYLKGKDFFFVTNRQNKTTALAKEIIRSLVNIGHDIPDDPDVVKEVLWYVQKANCEIRTLGNGKQTYEISGDGFGGKGSFVDDEKTVIINL